MLAPYPKSYLASHLAPMSPSPKIGGIISTNPPFGAPKYRTPYENELPPTGF